MKLIKTTLHQMALHLPKFLSTFGSVVKRIESSIRNRRFHFQHQKRFFFLIVPDLFFVIDLCPDLIFFSIFLQFSNKNRPNRTETYKFSSVAYSNDREIVVWLSHLFSYTPLTWCLPHSTVLHAHIGQYRK